MKANQHLSPPCEAHPAPVDGKLCGGCAWDGVPAGSATDAKRRLVVVRSPEAYGCLRRGAAITVDQEEGKPYMRIGDTLLPLSERYGSVIAGTRLEADIRSALVA